MREGIIRLTVFGVALGAALTLRAGTSVVNPGAGAEAYATIQAALNAAEGTATNRARIVIAPGVYDEFLRVDRPFVTLVAQTNGSVTVRSAEGVYTIKDKGLPRCEALSVAADDFEAEGIAFVNAASDAAVAAGKRGVGQAPAVVTKGDRVAFRNCRIAGFQAVLSVGRSSRVMSRAYFTNCRIEGAIDIVYGGGLAVFDACDIHLVRRGDVTAASTDKAEPFGFIFTDCRITRVPDEKLSLLGRPWRPYAKVVYLNCDFGDAIAAEGWSNWRKPENERTAWFGEFGCTGPGADVSRRPAWIHTASDEGASYFTARGKRDWRDVLAGSDGWAP